MSSPAPDPKRDVLDLVRAVHMERLYAHLYALPANLCMGLALALLIYVSWWLAIIIGVLVWLAASFVIESPAGFDLRRRWQRQLPEDWRQFA